MTVQIQRAAERFATRTEWLDSRHCFSFGEHYDPANVSHGALLVSNEDVVTSGRGYADHPHRDAEIVTWVLSGSLVHEDSQGNKGLIYPGLAQRMSAGRGIVHAERNDAFRTDPDRMAEPVRFVQMWIRPDDSGGEPSYQQRELELSSLANSWIPIASGSDKEAVVSLASKESTLWASRLAAGAALDLPAAPRVHLYLTSGEIEVETTGVVTAGDSVRLAGGDQLRLRGLTDAELLVWGMA